MLCPEASTKINKMAAFLHDVFPALLDSEHSRQDAGAEPFAIH